MDILKWLENWYSSNCDGDWEHLYGIKIGTLDNPGWSVEINLLETVLEDRGFERIKIDNSDDDWVFCWVEEGKFNGAGDPGKLTVILEIFRKWAQQAQTTSVENGG